MLPRGFTVEMEMENGVEESEMEWIAFSRHVVTNREMRELLFPGRDPGEPLKTGIAVGNIRDKGTMAEFRFNTEQEERNFLPFSGKLFDFCLSVMLGISCRPDLVEYQVVPARPAKVASRKTVAALWQPNFVGRNYAVKTKSAKTPGRLPTGRTVRLHWRRGHYANTPCGPERLLRRMVWREPVLVGGK